MLTPSSSEPSIYRAPTSTYNLSAKRLNISGRLCVQQQRMIRSGWNASRSAKYRHFLSPTWNLLQRLSRAPIAYRTVIIILREYLILDCFLDWSLGKDTQVWTKAFSADRRALSQPFSVFFLFIYSLIWDTKPSIFMIASVLFNKVIDIGAKFVLDTCRFTTAHLSAMVSERRSSRRSRRRSHSWRMGSF